MCRSLVLSRHHWRRILWQMMLLWETGRWWAVVIRYSCFSSNRWHCNRSRHSVSCLRCNSSKTSWLRRQRRALKHRYASNAHLLQLTAPIHLPVFFRGEQMKLIGDYCLALNWIYCFFGGKDVSVTLNGCLAPMCRANYLCQYIMSHSQIWTDRQAERIRKGC